MILALAARSDSKFSKGDVGGFVRSVPLRVAGCDAIAAAAAVAAVAVAADTAVAAADTDTAADVIDADGVIDAASDGLV